MSRIALLVFTCLVPLSAQKSSVPPPNAGYILGPGDQLTVYVSNLNEDFGDRTFRIDTSGDLSLPLIGHIHALGLTTNDLEQECKTRLTRQLKNPEVAVSLVAFGSQSVSVLGSVYSPGLRQLEGHKTLVEILSASGGLRPDASYQATVTREQKWGSIPLSGATPDPTGKTSVAVIKLKHLLNSADASQNIVIMPGDTIFVPKADLVYVVGAVVKPGGFLLNEHESLSALQVISLAEGTQKTAALDKAKVLRSVPGSPNRQEISVNLKKLMAGKGDELQLLPDDILFVPTSAAKSAGYRTLDSIVNAATGFAIYAGH